MLSFTSIVVHFTDTEPPRITCPKNIKVMKNTAGTVVPVHWPLLHYEDNSEQPVTLFTESVQGSGFRVGQNFIKYEARDQAGNTAFCTFTIIVTGRLQETQYNYINCKGPAERRLWRWPDDQQKKIRILSRHVELLQSWSYNNTTPLEPKTERVGNRRQLPCSEYYWCRVDVLQNSRSTISFVLYSNHKDFRPT